MKFRYSCFLLIILVCFSSCKKETQTPQPQSPPYLQIPAGFPPPNIPADNEVTADRVALGKKLFHEKLLSRDSSISCATCHKPELAFSDGLTRSFGIDGNVVTRNSPNLTNVLWATSLFWDGGSISLEHQAIAPIQNPLEMDFTVQGGVERIKTIPEYVELFRKAYNRDVDSFGLVRAIAAYQRTFISSKSKYDKYLAGDLTALNESEERGRQLFFGEKAECFHCHTGILFTDNSFQNNGLYTIYPDSGRYRITGKTSDIGKFRVPTLRNVAVTAPFMHDGSIPTLEAVIDHYASGGKGHPNQSPLVRPFNLTAQEKQDLVNFLKALTDTTFLNNPAFH
ncbi:MAG: cytochrome-c peroxidase [Bacteroidia bacterium]|nr:cytochrome-c peroxidase [Bacteroidia bacterium]